ncbi:hypothetical protein SNE40_010832 [Patella caerulea]|uniref:Uncharacterized protein n=1 Tax=Patella caerulea TaxID=87958 RepID=A0AAN8Q5J3_PATCE
MRGKHQIRPNKISEDRQQVPKYRSHYTRRHNPNRHYLSPELTQKLLFERYTEKCSNQLHIGCLNRYATERNYHFGQSSLGTCKTCDKLEMLIKADPGDKALASEEEFHLRKADSAQSATKHDFQSATEINSAMWTTIAFDFQQTLPTPHINTRVTFYSRQLWTYNFGIHDAKNVFMNMSEDTAGREDPVKFYPA